MRARVVTGMAALGVLIVGISLWHFSATGPRHADRASQAVALDPQSRIALLDSSLRDLQQGYREMPRDTWDPDYVVRMVGRDPRRLYAWVRDNTYWIPYRGVLRGPIGVLLDRQGNSLDRAILLAVLLQKTGRTVQLAHGSLRQEQVLALLPRLESERTANLAVIPRSASTEPASRLPAPQHGSDSELMYAGLQSQQQKYSRIVSELQSRVTDQAARLLRQLVRPDAETMRMGILDSALQSLSDHWWVQVRNGTRWEDLDLLAENPGSLVEAKEAFAIKDVPAELHHTITLRVIAEQWSNGKLQEHSTLEQVLRPSDLYGHTVALQFWPNAWFEEDAPAHRHTRAEALNLDSWNAMLAVDQNLLTAGILTSNGDDPHAPVKGGDFGGFAGAFGSTMGQKSANDNRQLSAVWLEYEIHVPGEKARIVRRSVFDLLGAAARSTSSPGLALDESKRLTRSLALTMKTEILPISCGLSPEFVTALLAQNLVDSRNLMSFLLQSEMSPAKTDPERPLPHSEPPISTLYALALARMELSRKGQVFINRPNLLTRHLYAAPTTDGIAILDATDIVANEVGVGLHVSDPFAARVEQGVLDTNAESLFRPGTGPGSNAGDAFAASRSWTGFSSRQVTATDAKLNLPSDVRAQIRRDLGNRYDVVAPQKPVITNAGEFAGWWRINPATGDVLGIGDNGWGAELAEHGAKDSETARIAPLWVRRIQTFAVAFAVNYGWCVVPLVDKQAHQPAEAWGMVQGNQAVLHHSLGIWEGAIKPVAKESVKECVADSIFIAGVTALFLPVGVVAGAGKAAESGPGAPHPPAVEGELGIGGGSGSKVAKPNSGKTLPGLGPNEPVGEPNAQPKPPGENPCNETQPGEAPSQTPEQGPEGPPTKSEVAKQLQEQIWTLDQAALDAGDQFSKALNDFLEYRNQFKPIYDEFGDPIAYEPIAHEGPNFDPKVLAEKWQVADQKFWISNDAYARAIEASRAWDKFVGNPYQAHHKMTACRGGSPAEVPQPISKLDPAFYEPPFADTQPSYGQPGTDPLSKTQPSFGQPGTDPLSKTQPNYGDPRSGKTLPGLGPPPPPTWDGNPCRWCSYLPPTYPDSDPNSKPSPSQSGPSGSYGQKTLMGLGGAGAAFSGTAK